MSKSCTKWYSYFNNESAQSQDVLLCNITVYRKTILVATMQNNITKFTKFNSINAFYEYYNQSTLQHRTFYAVLTHNTRYLYLDVDYKLSDSLSRMQHSNMIEKITSLLSDFIIKYGQKFNVYNRKCNWIIWTASRSHKFSLHLLDIGNVIHIVDNKHFAEAFNYWLHINHKIPNKCIIDSKIYHEQYQLWRLPYCHNGNIDAILRLFNNNIPIIKQFQISFMNDLRRQSIQCISTNFKLPTLFVHKTQYNICNKYVLQTDSHIKSIKKPCSKLIQNKLYAIFKTSKIRPYKNNEFLILEHHCPLAERCHKSNTGRICIVDNVRQSEFNYCIYSCMHSDCRKVMKSINISLSDTWKYPWLICKFKAIKLDILKELDRFLYLLFSRDMIKYKGNSYQDSIIKFDKMIFNIRALLFCSFIENNVIHTKCNKSRMTIYYKKKHDKNYFYGALTIYCVECNIFFNYKNNCLIIS